MIGKIFYTVISVTAVIWIWKYRHDSQKVKWFMKWPFTLWLVYLTIEMLLSR
jgi:hypothetical protein